MNSPKLEPCIPLPLDDKTLEEIIDKAKDWAIMHGASLRSKQSYSKDLIQVILYNFCLASLGKSQLWRSLGDS